MRIVYFIAMLKHLINLLIFFNNKALGSTNNIEDFKDAISKVNKMKTLAVTRNAEQVNSLAPPSDLCITTHIDPST